MGTTAGVGLAVGPTLAGWLVGALGWRAAFAVFAGAGLLLLAGAAAMADSRAEERPRVDVGGALALIGALSLTMFGVNQAAAAGWASARVLVPLGLGVAMLVMFVLVERRVRHPVLDLGLLRDRRFVAWDAGRAGAGRRARRGDRVPADLPAGRGWRLRAGRGADHAGAHDARACSFRRWAGC
ncbi:hypothetical protein GCM10020220_010960 [Nonomuraea rubra]